jgi:hypothetical protein
MKTFNIEDKQLSEREKIKWSACIRQTMKIFIIKDNYQNEKKRKWNACIRQTMKTFNIEDKQLSEQEKRQN